VTGRPERIRRLEHIGLATWPALEQHTDGSWVLRTARGVTSRSNSVSPLGPPSRNLKASLGDAERWYATQGLPCRFRLTDLAPTELETTLGARGYRRENAVDVMTRRIGDASEPGDVRIDPAPSARWFEALMSRRFPHGTDPVVVRSMLARLPTPTAYAELEAAGEVAAMGMSVVWDDAVAIYVMHTARHLRGSGLGTQVLQALQAWGRSNGATMAFLQVQTENTPARAFYSSHGFGPEYQYWYRTQVTTQ
jgi:ribosomal protein S18 acetylase RimI-like enzyme